MHGVDLFWQVCFEEDAGFYLALRKLASDSKCPIVLTCNSVPDELLELQTECHTLTFQRPPPEALLPYVASVARAAGMRISERHVRELIDYMDGDVRRMLQTLQCWCGGLRSAATSPEPAAAAADATIAEASSASSMPTSGSSIPTSGTPAHIGDVSGTEAPMLCLERALGVHNVSGHVSIGALLTAVYAEEACELQPHYGALLQSRVLLDASLFLSSSPILEHPLRMLDTTVAGALLGHETYEATVTGYWPTAVQLPGPQAGPDTDVTDDADVGDERPRRGRAATFDVMAAPPPEGNVARRGSGRVSLRLKRSAVVVSEEEGDGEAGDGTAVKEVVAKKVARTEAGPSSSAGAGDGETEPMGAATLMEVEDSPLEEANATPEEPTQPQVRAVADMEGEVEAEVAEAAEADAGGSATGEREVEAAADVRMEVEPTDEAGGAKASAKAEEVEAGPTEEGEADTATEAVDTSEANGHGEACSRPMPDHDLAPDHGRVVMPLPFAWAYPEAAVAPCNAAHECESLLPARQDESVHRSCQELEAVAGLYEGLSAATAVCQPDPSAAVLLQVLALRCSHQRLRAADSSASDSHQSCVHTQPRPLERSPILFASDEVAATAASAATAATVAPLISRASSTIHAIGAGTPEARLSAIETLGALRSQCCALMSPHEPLAVSCFTRLVSTLVPLPASHAPPPFGALGYA